MKGLVLYELKKIFSKKSVIIILVFLLSLNIYKVFDRNSKMGLDKGYDLIYEKVKGEITKEKVDFVTNTLKEKQKLVAEGQYDPINGDKDSYSGYTFGDMNIFSYYYDLIKNAYQYQDKLETVFQKANENATLFQDQYEKNKNNDIINRYQDRGIEFFYEINGFTNLLTYDFSCFLIIIMFLWILVPMFSKERENMMENLIKTTDRGRKKIAAAKIISAFMITFCISMLFFMSDVIAHGISMHLDGWMNPLYSIPVFTYTPVNLTILGYYICQIICKLVILCTIGMLMLLLSSVIMDSITTYFTTIIFLAALLIAGNTWRSNPVNLLMIHSYLQSYDVINIMNIPILSISIYMLIMIIILGLEIGFTYITYLKKSDKKHQDIRRLLMNKYQEIVS